MSGVSCCSNSFLPTEIYGLLCCLCKPVQDVAMAGCGDGNETKCGTRPHAFGHSMAMHCLPKRAGELRLFRIDVASSWQSSSKPPGRACSGLRAHAHGRLLRRHGLHAQRRALHRPTADLRTQLQGPVQNLPCRAQTIGTVHSGAQRAV